jgi:hypothetical protein
MKVGAKRDPLLVQLGFFRAKFHSKFLYSVEKKIVGISQYAYFRISHFLIESNFNSCKEISLEISLNFFVKTQHFSKETGRPEKFLQFKMQFAQLC